MTNQGTRWLLFFLGEKIKVAHQGIISHKTMNKELLKFWVTCPDCKRKFGVDPFIVLKYVDRLFNELGDRIKERGEQLEKARKEKEGA